MTSLPTRPALSRRRFLLGLGALGALPALAACGATATPTIAPAASVAPTTGEIPGRICSSAGLRPKPRARALTSR